MRYMAIYGSYEHGNRAETARRLRRYRRSLQRTRKRLVEERAAMTAAERANLEKDRALAAVCHDLRTPLNAILGWAQVARSVRNDAAELGEALSRIEANARVQGMLINDILDLARSAAGMLHIERRPVDLNDVVAAALSVTEPTASAKQLRVEWTPAASPALVLGDSTRLQQVVWNLLTNAIKFTPSGGRVSVELTGNDVELRLRVSDTGRGINPAFMAKLFERFQQDGPSGPRHAPGAGLGLPIVRRLVEMHGGSVEVQSAGVDRGSTFTVCLPRLRSEDPSGASAA
jgi:signal transduction histidine kinase